MQDRHRNRLQYFEEQAYTTEKYVIPFIRESHPIDPATEVLEIGCGEGGNLKPFVDMGCSVTGIDLSLGKIENAKIFFGLHGRHPNITFICENIYNIAGDIGTYDLVMLRDVLEHIPEQLNLMKAVRRLIKPGGSVFIGFPPWQSPFGGHQQMCESRILSKVPYFHILPASVMKGLFKLFGEREKRINELLETKKTGLTIEQFRTICKRALYRIDREVFYMINPNYEIKFNLRPRKQLKIVNSLPFIRNFFITTCYYSLSMVQTEPLP